MLRSGGVGADLMHRGAPWNSPGDVPRRVAILSQPSRNLKLEGGNRRKGVSPAASRYSASTQQLEVKQNGYHHPSESHVKQERARSVIHPTTNAKDVDMVTVTFELPYKTALGQSIEIVGSLPELGGWYHDAAFQLQWCGGHIWRGSVKLPAGSVAEFKCVLKHSGGRWWQAGKNRRLEVPRDEKFVEVRCRWDSEAVAVLPVIPPNGDWKVLPPVAGSGENGAYLTSAKQLIRTVVVLSVDEVNHSSTYRLVGSVPQMGCWDLSAAPSCRWAGDHTLACVVELPPGQVCNFKVVRVCDTGEALWQPGRNRSISTPFCSAEDFTLLASCSWESETVDTEIRQANRTRSHTPGLNGKGPSMVEVQRLQADLQAAGTGMTNARQALKEKEAELARAKQSSQASETKIEEMQRLVDELRSKHVQLQHDWRESEGQLTSALMQQLADAERALKTERSRNEQQRYGTAAAAAAVSASPSAASSGQSNRAMSQLEVQADEVSAMKAQLKSVRRELAAARSQIADLRGELEAASAAHKERLERAEDDARGWLQMAREEGRAEVERVQKRLAEAEAALLRSSAERAEAEATAQSALQVERARNADLTRQLEEQSARLAAQVEEQRAAAAARDADIIDMRKKLAELRCKLTEAQAGEAAAQQKASASGHRERRLAERLEEQKAKLARKAKYVASVEGKTKTEDGSIEAELQAAKQRAAELEERCAGLESDRRWAEMDAAGSASALARLEARVSAQWNEMEELRTKLAEVTEELHSERQQSAAAAEVRALLATALDCAEEEWEARLRVVEGASQVIHSRMELAVGQLRDERLRPFLSPSPDSDHKVRGGEANANGAAVQRGWVHSVESPII